MNNYKSTTTTECAEEH